MHEWRWDRDAQTGRGSYAQEECLSSPRLTVQGTSGQFHAARRGFCTGRAPFKNTSRHHIDVDRGGNGDFAPEATVETPQFKNASRRHKIDTSDAGSGRMGEGGATPAKESFEFVKHVGRGGQARVEIWKRASTGELYAWKVYEAPEPGMADKIATEAAMLIRLDHEALVHGYWFWMPSKAGEPAVICMENMEGGPLAAAIQKNSMTPTMKNCTIISLVKGLGMLHSKKNVDRDLKLGNCFSLLTEWGRSATSGARTREGAAW